GEQLRRVVEAGIAQKHGGGGEAKRPEAAVELALRDTRRLRQRLGVEVGKVEMLLDGGPDPLQQFLVGRLERRGLGGEGDLAAVARAEVAAGLEVARDPGEELLRAERLLDVVIGAG